MRNLIFIASIILLAGIIFWGYSLLLKRTPEKIIKQQFNISLKNFDYTIESFEEQWYPNGDGHTLIVVKFAELTQENIDYLKRFNPQSLPIQEIDCPQIVPNKIPKQYLDTNVGYYLYESLSRFDIRNYKIFIINTEKKIAILYYQYM